jgi:hypothetical protein
MWRIAQSLAVLRNQINATYPNRNKVSDGTIGDAAHQAVASDHNPNPQGVVCAMDITHHAGYFDAHALADRLITNRHPNLKYIVSNNRIAGAWTGWRWQKYNGSNPHTKHIHVSVGAGEDGHSRAGTYDDPSPWSINAPQPAPQQPKLQGGELPMNPQQENHAYQIVLGRPMEHGGSGRTGFKFIVDAQPEIDAKREVERQKDVYIQALKNDLNTLKQQADELAKRPTKAALDDLQTNLTVCAAGADQHVNHITSLQQKINDMKATEYKPTEPEKFLRHILESIKHIVSLDKINAVFKRLRR